MPATVDTRRFLRWRNSATEQIKEKLKALPGWEYKNNAISKTFKFKEFLHGIEFVQKVAEIAEAADHHPDITINYTRVTFSCSTHDAGGVTDKDFKLAREYRDRVQGSRRVGHARVTSGCEPPGPVHLESSSASSC